MLTVTDAQKNAYLSASEDIQVTVTFPNKSVTFTNQDLIEESIELIESIEDSKSLEFKGCIASQLNFKVADIIQDLRGEYVEVDIKAGTTESLPLFRGYVYSQTNQTHEDIFTEFSCYDILKSIRDTNVKAWYNGLTFPITIKNFRDSLFTFLDITQETTTLPNDTLTIAKETIDTLYAGELLENLCQANARFGQIGRDGKFYYRTLNIITEGTYPSTQTFPGPNTYPSGENACELFSPSYYKSLKYEPFFAEAIDKVIIVNANNSTTTQGSGDNALVLEDNIVARNFTDKATAILNIYGEVERRPYIPLDLKCIGLPYLECGDIILSYTQKNVVRSFILRRRLTGIQALFDEYESEGNQYRDLYHESTEQATTANYTQGKTNASAISGVSVRVGSLEADHVSVSQLNAVSAQINDLTAIAITTQNLSAQNISANQITSGTISANRIAANSIKAEKLDANSFQSWSLSCQSVSAGSSFYYGGYQYVNKSVTINGTGYNILARP